MFQTTYVLGAMALVVWFGWCAWLVVTDMRFRLLPNRLIGAGLISTFSVIYMGWTLSGNPEALFGVIPILGGIFAFFILVAFISRGAFGMGDVKFAPLCYLIPATHGWETGLSAVLLSLGLASLLELSIALLRRGGLNHKFAFGPYMFLGALMSLLVI